MKTMKAITVVESHKLEIRDIPVPTISNDDVLVKIKSAGICGSDMHVYHGTSPVATYPRVIGHEASGEVVEIGKNVTTLKIGDHVTLEPLRHCGHCYNCSQGRPNACITMKACGAHIDGYFQEYVSLPAKHAYKISSDIPWDIAAMVEPYTIAAQVCFRTRIKKDDTALIIGAGPIGLFILDMFHSLQAKCAVVDIVDSRLALAKELGAEIMINSLNESTEDKIKEWTNGLGVNVSVDAACLPKTFEQAVSLTGSGGRVACLGFTQEPSQIPQFQITARELDVVGCRHQTYRFEPVVEMFEKGLLNPKKLLTHKFSYKQVQEAFTLLETDPISTCKVILDWDNN